jgi:hypothetical protein
VKTLVLILTLIVTTACSGSHRMAEPHVTLTLHGRAVLVTQQDGERMRAALIAALSQASDPALQAEGARLRESPVVIGTDLRIGPWLLDKRGDEPVLVWRQQSAPGGLVNQLARLSATSSGDWSVTSIDQELVHRR